MLNRKMKSKMGIGFATVLAVALLVAGCGTTTGGTETATVGTESATVVASTDASIDLSDVTAVITLSDNGSIVSGNGASVEDNDIVITSGGTYSFSGTLTEGRIKVEAEGQDVTIVLNGVTITNSEKDAIYIEYANSATIYVMEGTENVLTSGTETTYEEAKAATDEANASTETNVAAGGADSAATETGNSSAATDVSSSDDSTSSEDNTSTTETSSADTASASESTDSTEAVDEGFSNSQKATIMAKCSLTLSGSGSLTVNGYINNGIQSKEILTISDVNLTLVSANDGIKAGTELNITSGTFDIDSYGDAIQSDGTLNISDGYFDIFTGNGSASAEKKSEAMPGGGGMGGERNNSDMITKMLERMGVEGASDLATALEEAGVLESAPKDMSTIVDWLNGLVEDGTISSDYQTTIDAIESAMSSFQPGQMGAQNQANMQPTGDSSQATDNTGNAAPQSTDMAGQAPQMGGGGFGGGMMDDTADSVDSDSNSVSQKGIKAEGEMTIDGGTFTIDTVDDAIHGTSDVVINAGTFNITSGDDGVHSDTNLTVNGGTITVEDSYEGIEAGVITINDGEISVTSSDDGFNASTTLTDPDITINGGVVYVNASGDGLDSNKNLTINGGTVYVDGPSEDMNSAIDIGTENQGIFVINGGTVTAVGSSGMLENADSSSTQQTITYVFSEKLEEGTVITVSDSSGNEVASFTLIKSASAVTYSSADLVSAETYTFTAGDQSGEITADSINATNSTGGMGMGGHGGMGGRGMMQGQMPTDGQAPTGGQAPSGDQMPAGGQAPSGEAPANEQAPASGN
ncbi:MAG: carbohydrate-binding domain-containing protein [Butyrivibrio sp.]|nr:carbohydrate-binding domain-containing protein [Butyrivibrio sp.]